MSKRYAEPPVVEAVCEFRFGTDTEWDLTVPGLIYDKVRDAFPLKEQRVSQEIEVSAGPHQVGGMELPVERMVFLDTLRRSFIQVGQRMLAMNCLRPYPGWNGFRPKIERVFGAVSATVRVGGLGRIGLRYVNRIEVPGSKVDLDQHFQFRPFLAQELPQDMLSFIVGCLLPFENGRDLCRLQLTGAVPEKPGHMAVQLDLDYFLAGASPLAPGDALAWIENAHEETERLFEGCITDRLRALFKEIG